MGGRPTPLLLRTRGLQAEGTSLVLSGGNLSCQRSHCGCPVEPCERIVLVGQRSVAVVTPALRLGPVDNADVAFKPRLRDDAAEIVVLIGAGEALPNRAVPRARLPQPHDHFRLHPWDRHSFDTAIRPCRSAYPALLGLHLDAPFGMETFQSSIFAARRAMFPALKTASIYASHRSVDGRRHSRNRGHGVPRRRRRHRPVRKDNAGRNPRP
ncbi:hypothetical protein ABID08_004762 [Rhizobium binae]|uniref:Uncharacterized protein n=1 Tax=Rhizobium binae TaxID=1138190 RepID=A0ABV2MLQ8_9HYPH